VDQQGRLTIDIECEAGYTPSIQQIITLLSTDSVYIGAFLGRLIPELYWVTVQSTDPANEVFVLDVEHYGDIEDILRTLTLGIAEYLEIEEENVNLVLVEGSSKRQERDTFTSVIEVNIVQVVSAGHSLAPFFGALFVIIAVLFHQ